MDGPVGILSMLITLPHTETLQTKAYNMKKFSLFLVLQAISQPLIIKDYQLLKLWDLEELAGQHHQL